MIIIFQYHNLFYICSVCKGAHDLSVYRRRKWTQLREFKFETSLFAFNMTLNSIQTGKEMGTTRQNLQHK